MHGFVSLTQPAYWSLRADVQVSPLAPNPLFHAVLNYTHDNINEK
jgi:hypothetical protein